MMRNKILWILPLMFLVLSVSGFSAITDSNIAYTLAREETNDLSLNGNNFIGYGTPLFFNVTPSTVANLKGMYKLDSADDYFDAPFSFDDTEDWSFNMWITDQETSSSALNVIFSQRDSYSTMDWYLAHYPSSHLTQANKFEIFIGESGGSGSTGFATYDLSSGWHMITFTKASSKYEVFIDAVSQGSYTSSQTWTESETLHIGKMDSNFYWNGNNSNLGVWTRDLTQSEITSLYNSGNGLELYPEVVINATNFTITVTSGFSGNDVNDVSANISLENGSSLYYTNTTGNIMTTSLLTNESQIVNITVDSYEWMPTTYTNYNTSDNLEAKLNQTYITLKPYELITENEINSCSWSILTHTYDCNENISIDIGTYNATFTDSNYFTRIDEVKTIRPNAKQLGTDQDLPFVSALGRLTVDQSFTANDTIISSITLRIKETGTILTDLPVRLREDLAGSPSTVLKEINITTAELDTSFKDIELEFNQTVTEGSTYWITIDGVSSTDGSNFATVDAGSGSFSETLIYASVPSTAINSYYIVGFNQDKNRSLYNYSNARVNVSVKDISTSTDDNNITVTVDSLNYTYTSTESSTNGYVELDLINGSWNISAIGEESIFNDITVDLAPLDDIDYNFTYRVFNITFKDENTSLPLVNDSVGVVYPNGAGINYETDSSGSIYINTVNAGYEQFGNYTITFDGKDGYITPENFTKEIQATDTNFSQLYEIEESYINITIYDRETNELINTSVVLTITGLGEFNTSTGNLLLRNTSIPADTYTVYALATGYELAQFGFEYDTREGEQIDLYLLNSTSTNTGQLIVIVSDEYGNNQLDADTRLLEYDISSDSFNQVAQCFSNSNGECFFGVELGIKAYVVTATKEINGITYNAQSSERGQIYYIDQYQVNLFLKTEAIYEVSDEFSLNMNIFNKSLVNNISYLTADFYDSENIQHTVCIQYDWLDGLIKKKLLQNCVTGASGIVNVNNGYQLNRSLTYLVSIYTNRSGKITPYYDDKYPSINSFEGLAGGYATYIIVLAFITLMSFGIALRNLYISAIGFITCIVLWFILLPTWFDWRVGSSVILLSINIMWLSRKRESGYGV